MPVPNSYFLPARRPTRTIRDRTLGGGALGESELLRKRVAISLALQHPATLRRYGAARAAQSAFSQFPIHPPARVCPRGDEEEGGCSLQPGTGGLVPSSVFVLTLPLPRTTVYLPMDEGESGALPVTQHPGGAGTHFRTVRGPTAPHNVLKESRHLRSPPPSLPTTMTHSHQGAARQ
jgi:hypothetical protein